MSYGLQIKNNNNEFLISSDMRNLHHYATYTNPSISVPFTNYGGLTRFTYTFTLDGNYVPVPFFTTPFNDRYYAIEKISNSGNTWTVQLISSNGFPTTTTTSTNPTSSSIVPTLSSVQFQAPNTGTSNDFVYNRSPNSGDHYIMLFHGPTTPPIMAGTNYNGNLLLKIVWDGAVVPLVGADSNGNVTVNVTNGVFPTNYTADGNAGFVSTDGNAYFPFETNGTDQPSHVHDNPVRNIFEFLQNPPQHYVAQNLFRVARQTYVTTGGSSGNSATGSYGSAQIPKLIVFADARAVTASETYGMKVFKDDGTAAFDNRKKPLILKEVTAVAHQSTATNNFSGSGLSARNASGPTSTWSTQASPHRFVGVQVNTMPTNTMYYYATVTQVHQQVSRTELEEECDGVEVKGNCLGSRRTYTWRSTYWNFYRGAIQRFNDTNIYGGYINVEFGSYHSRTTSGGFFGFNTGNSSGSTVGKWPWDSAQINNAGTGVNTLLIADASNYI